MTGLKSYFQMQFSLLVGSQTIILIELASIPVIRQENSMFIEFAPILDFPTKTLIFRHPGKANALTEFMHLNEAFVEIVRWPNVQIWSDKSSSCSNWLYLSGTLSPKLCSLAVRIQRLQTCFRSARNMSLERSFLGTIVDHNDKIRIVWLWGLCSEKIYGWWIVTS